MSQVRTELQNFYSKFNLLEMRLRKFRRHSDERLVEKNNAYLEALRVSTDSLVDELTQQDLNLHDGAQTRFVEFVAAVGSGKSLEKLADKFGRAKLFDFVTYRDFKITPFSRALGAENLDAVKWFVEADKDLVKNPVTYFKGSPLYAVPFVLIDEDGTSGRGFKYDADKAIAVMKELLKAGADINGLGSSYTSPSLSALDSALGFTYFIIIRKGMGEGFDVRNTCPSRGVTVGIAGIEKYSLAFGHLEVRKLNKYDIHDFKVAKFLLENGAKNVGLIDIDDVHNFVRDVEIDKIPSIKELVGKYPDFVKLMVDQIIEEEVKMVRQIRKNEDRYPRGANKENGSNKWAHLVRNDSTATEKSR